VILSLSLFVATLFFLLELSARVYLFGPLGLHPRKLNSTYRLRSSGHLQPSRHPELRYELKPSIDSYFKLVPFRTNSRGLRDQEYPLEKPANTFRVAVLGSSMTLPSGVEIERAFHSLLEKRLTEESAFTRYEFINFAVGTYQPSQVVGMLELRALEYDPDLILFPITGKSAALMTKPLRRAGPKFEEEARTYPFLRSFLLEVLQGRGRRFATPEDRPKVRFGRRIGVLERFVMWVDERLSTREAAEPAAARDDSRGAQSLPSTMRSGALEWRPHQTVLQRLGEITAETGIPIVVVRLAFHGPKQHPLDLKIEAQIQKHRMHFLCTRDAFEGLTLEDLWIYRVDPHPNAIAHEIFADVIASFLRSNHLLSRKDRP
jgi:hypothetical protein